ncbi:HesA/MoeB/ThiF family protein [Burkholderia thailandensis]|uniref:HesA/MoeB/ThiF family protein n=1 Tax=Burkholderia thailandensis TaxID=57975 RepID=UPI0022ABDAF7|nr:ThiF family adenylyltransferase [Burkholderia thailandensis]MCZ2900953.1 ThiF family adenylyltransferase [Burkholderia thailandensis]MDD1480967.1 ThiF family adenylyltransferase [Burkholderia thailandensis]MDD1489140.1 ThiF family adenylyltransferase [Burkholderia thailandensis]MDD1493906.1 ThiF family adenylyltransferase [Burkholderia thailandensis]
MGNRHSRQSFLGPMSEERLRMASAAVIGLCGGGSHVSQQLAHIGIGDLLLIDPDRADDTNTNRMVGLTEQEADDEEYKVDVVERKLRLVNSSIKIRGFARPWQEVPDELKRCNVIFGCVDSITVREQLERFARRYAIPYIDIGMDVHGDDGRYFITGQVITSLPFRPCMRCMGFITEAKLAAEQARYGAAGGRPQVVWPNGVLASTAVGIFMSMYTPWNKDATPAIYIEYDGNRNALAPSNRLQYLEGVQCDHFVGTEGVGDVF